MKTIFGFLWRNKIWWLIPVIAVLVFFLAVVIFAGNSPFGPFIYTITNF